MLSGYPLGQRIAMFTYRRARAGEETRQVAARGVGEGSRHDGIRSGGRVDRTGARDNTGGCDDAPSKNLRRGCGAEGHRGDLLLRLCNR